MPTRNRVKVYGKDQYYHVYNRGVNKDTIFVDDDDYVYFLGLFKKYLSPADTLDNYRHPIAKYTDQVELVTYCLMPNHYHLLVYLKESEGLINLMRSVMTAYTLYFNKRYKRTGHLYQDVFLASRITSDEYLWHVSRYIHLNPKTDYKKYLYSSIDYYTGNKSASWLHPERLIETKEDQKRYLKFVDDHEAMHAELEELKHSLAAE